MFSIESVCRCAAVSMLAENACAYTLAALIEDVDVDFIR